MISELEAAWLQQVAWCEQGGSPFTACVLKAAWDDWLAGGTLRELMPDWPRDPWPDAVPLRVAGALHAMALDGSNAELAALYPPAHDTFDPVAGPPAIRNALRTQRARVAEYLRHPPQTNEIGRSAVLLGGFATIAARTGLPLALREIGASAGLNLLWHRYHYALGPDLTWGDPTSPVTVRSEWRGTPPELPAAIRVNSWSGCDVAPIDLRRPGAAVRLASYVWPDQRERLLRLQAAIAMATATDMVVEQLDAADFVARELDRIRPGEITTLYHSIFWLYLSSQTRGAIRASIQAAGARATPAAPVAWLAFEMPDPQSRPLLTLTLWPGGQRETLARAHAHGHSANWSIENGFGLRDAGDAAQPGPA